MSRYRFFGRPRATNVSAALHAGLAPTTRPYKAAAGRRKTTGAKRPGQLSHVGLPRRMPHSSITFMPPHRPRISAAGAQRRGTVRRAAGPPVWRRSRRRRRMSRAIRALLPAQYQPFDQPKLCLQASPRCGHTSIHQSDTMLDDDPANSNWRANPKRLMDTPSASRRPWPVAADPCLESLLVLIY